MRKPPYKSVNVTTHVGGLEPIKNVDDDNNKVNKCHTDNKNNSTNQCADDEPNNEPEQ